MNDINFESANAENEEVSNDNQVELTLAKNGQITLDNDEVFLTLNDKVYGFLLVNNDVTIVENDEYLQVLNSEMSQSELDETTNFNDFNIETLEETDEVSLLILPENWVLSETSPTMEGNVM